MRAYNRLRKSRGFTLVELMIVVAIIGILAALAIYGVNRYLNSAKTGEAKQNVGAIARSASAAWDRRMTPSELLGDASTGSATTNALCSDTGGAPPVPGAAPPPGIKYQPSTAAGADFNQGTDVDGWACLRFTVSQPIAFQYDYNQGVGAAGTAISAAAGGPSAAAGAAFEAVARGDLDGDTTAFGTFTRIGEVTNGQLKLASEVYISNEYE